MSKKIQSPMPYTAREDAKRRGRDLLAEGATLASRVEGATLVLIALHERSRELSGYPRHHPPFSTYVQMLDLEKGVCLPADVVEHLRAVHGPAIRDGLPAYTSNWSPRGASSSGGARSPWWVNPNIH